MLGGLYLGPQGAQQAGVGIQKQLVSGHRDTTSVKHVDQEAAEKLCPICSNSMDIYAVGSCNHAVCFKCAVRMRAICNLNYCAICRAELEKIFFCDIRRDFLEFKESKCSYDRKYQLYFTSQEIEHAYNELFVYKCSKCHSQRYPESSFRALQAHMQRQHQLFYCNICLEGVKLFAFERKAYTRSGLARHMRIGDVDDKSHKGHPLCEFCDWRYLDNEELFKHLRRDHFHCDFCEVDGWSNVYYSGYPELLEHFRAKHHVCEEGECEGARFTNVFRTEIDLKVHYANVHVAADAAGGKLSRAQARQARVLDVEFNLPPRPGRGGRGRAGYRGRGAGREYNRRYAGRESERSAVAAVSCAPDSPSDSSEHSSGTDSEEDDHQHTHHPHTHRQSKSRVLGKGKDYTQEFPDLSGDAAAVQPSTDLSETPAVSKTVTAPSVSDFAKRAAEVRGISVQHGSMAAAEFPALGTSSTVESNTTIVGPWAKSSRVDPSTTVQKTLPRNYSSPELRQQGKAPPPRSWARNVEFGAHLMTERDFPALGETEGGGPSGRKTTASQRGSHAPLSVGPWHSGRSEATCAGIADTLPTTDASTPEVSRTASRKPSHAIADEGLTLAFDESQFPGLTSAKRSDRPAEAPVWPRQQNLLGKDSQTQPPDIDLAFPKAEKKSWFFCDDNDKVKVALRDAPGVNREPKIDGKGPIKYDSKLKIVTEEVVPKPVGSSEETADSGKKSGKKKQKKKGTKPKAKKSAEKKQPEPEPKPGMVNFADYWRADKPEEDKREFGHTAREKGATFGFSTPSESGSDTPSDWEDVEVAELLEKPSLSTDFTPKPLDPLTVRGPPPGLLKKPPPPGFQKVDRKLVMAALPQPTDTSSSGDTNASEATNRTAPPGLQAPAVPGVYIQPAEFHERNSLLGARIQSLFNANSACFAEFRRLSTQFRQDPSDSDASAQEYFQSCAALVGLSELLQIFPEFIALLPNIVKQRQLLDVYRAEKAKFENTASKTSKKSSKAAWTTDSSNEAAGLFVCHNCGQVCTREDLEAHVKAHDLDNEFPTLGTTCAGR